MKRILPALVAAVALLFVSNTAMAHGPYYRPGVRFNIYGGYRPYYGVYRPFYGPLYYPPPGYYAPYPVVGPPVIAPSVNFSYSR